MSKIGNTPTGITQSFPSKQNITGNGGTSYTLNHTVTQPEELEVFVNNVRQNPGDAYTVNHNTITFAGAISSTDSCYAVFQNNINRNPAQFDVSRTVTTLNANNADVSNKIAAGVIEGKGGVTYDPPGSSGSETSTNVGLALHSGKRIVLGHAGYIRTIIDATASQPLKIGQAGTGYIATTQIYGGGSNGVHLFYDTDRKLQTTSIGVSVTGSLSVSAQPTCLLYKNGNQSVSQNTGFQVTGWAAVNDPLSMYDNSNGRITVPVAGQYIVGGHIQTNQVGGVHISILKNGAAIGVDSYLNMGDALGSGYSICINCSANDYFTMGGYVTTAATNVQANRSKFWIQKVA